MFRSIDKQDKFPSIEQRILELWGKDDSFNKSLEKNKNNEPFAFYDGPPFATGLPHYGHLLAGTIKDIVPRYWSMKGKYVPRRFGWDCHGLPIESLIQNELKLDGVAAIRKYGEDKFNEACRGSVFKYTAEWRKTVGKMGRWVDFDNDYKTMDTTFMESVWWVFKQCFEKGLIYQGYRIQPYSPALATPLSNFETNQGYKDRQDPSLTVQFQIEGTDEKILVWTTTPWTLPSNMAIAVGPEVEYSLVLSREKKFWIASGLVGKYFKQEEVEILKTAPGSELVGKKYQPLFNFVPPHDELYQIRGAEFVSTGDGTGAVHIAPSFGEDDFNLGQEVGLPLFDPLDVEGKFTNVVPQWEGQGAKEADKSIIAQLKSDDKVFKHATLEHSYPHCYRTGVPLLYRALKTWFLKLDVELTNEEGETKTLKQWMVDSNQQINWVPSHIKDGRFGKWLVNARDWNLSRNRFWGTPLPIWIAEDGEQICVGSVEELKELSGVELDDLHKHFVDGIVIEKDGKKFTRTPEVFDCWFESGSMPYAQNHYPFENKENVEAAFPADFIAEGLDQTRGWFYTLTVLSAALFQKPAFKNVVVNGIILAEDGQKMSKSLKNYPDPNDLIDRVGADAIRLFLINSAAVKADDLKFSETGVSEIVRSVLLPLWNVVGLFTTYANADQENGQLTWKPGETLTSDNELDQWILAQLQKLLGEIKVEMEAFHLYNVVPAVVAFIDDLTNWYVRRSRRRFWKSENDQDKNFAYATLYEVLVTFSKVLAPFLPFLSEEIYQILVREVNDNAPVSVHLCDFPDVNQDLINEALVQKMELIRSSINMGRALRAKHQLKNRQPLSTFSIISINEEYLKQLECSSELIQDELNIKNVEFSKDETSVVELKAKANFKVLGKKMGKNMKTVAAQIGAFSQDDVLKLQQGGSIQLEEGEITSDDILIQREVKEGTVVEANEQLTVALDTNITTELKQECIARELVNRIQNSRKDSGLDVTDQINIYTNVEKSLFLDTLSAHKEYITRETLAKSLEVNKELASGDQIFDVEIEEEKFKIKIVKC